MTVLDLSLVTKAITTLLEMRINVLLHNYVQGSSVWPTNATLTVSPQPPDVSQSGNVLTFYLYHIKKDSDSNNQSQVHNNQPPVRYTPMGVTLYYQLSARSDLQDDSGTFREQLLQGLAVKTLHDYPVINDSTEIVDKTNKVVKILEDVGLDKDGNRFKLYLQPIEYNEATNYWTAGSHPLRLATYYSVSVVLLEPEKPTSRAGRVLTYGVHTFVRGAPRLDSCSNCIIYQIPGETEKRKITLQPAQAPPVSQTQEESIVIFTGTNLTGDKTEVLLTSPRWDKPVSVDNNWNPKATGEIVSIYIQETINGKEILPGIYGALVEVTSKKKMPDGTVRYIKHQSNEVPFAVSPRIDSITPAGLIRRITGYIFQGGNPIGDLPIQIYVGNEQLEKSVGGNLGIGEFSIVDDKTIDILLPQDLKAGDILPIRLFVNGIESTPNWIIV